MSRADDFPYRSQGLAEVGELAAMLASRFIRFRVSAVDHDDGTIVAYFTLRGYLSLVDAERLLGWVSETPARSAVFAQEEGETLVISVRYQAFDEGEAAE